jgi:hypothetical protein
MAISSSSCFADVNLSLALHQYYDQLGRPMVERTFCGIVSQLLGQTK